MNIIQFKRKDQQVFAGFSSFTRSSERNTTEEVFLTSGTVLSLAAPIVLSIALGDILSSAIFALSSVAGILIGILWFYLNKRSENGLNLRFQPEEKPLKQRKFPKAA